MRSHPPPLLMLVPMAGLLMLTATWAMVVPSLVVDPAAAERHFISSFNDGEFAFDEDDQSLPAPAPEAPIERLPARADEGSGAVR